MGGPLAANQLNDRGPNLFTKASWVAEQLRREILLHVVAPGSALQQEDVARRLGVSSTPVREAFAILEAEGLLQKRPHHGVIVSNRDPNELVDIYNLRMIIEPHAFRRALPHITDDIIGELERCTSQATERLRVGDVHASRRANSLFHEILADSAGSAVVTEITRSLISRSLYAIPLNLTPLENSIGRHRQIVKALKTKRNAEASKLMKDHLREMNELLRESLRASGQLEQ